MRNLGCRAQREGGLIGEGKRCWFWRTQGLFSRRCEWFYCEEDAPFTLEARADARYRYLIHILQTRYSVLDEL